MGVIRCDGCDRIVDLDWDDSPICDEKDNTWICGMCQEKEKVPIQTYKSKRLFYAMAYGADDACINRILEEEK